MIKLSAFRPVGLGLFSICFAGFAHSAASEPAAQASPSGATTTYFPQSASTGSVPSTTGALPETKSSATTAISTPAPTPATAEPAASSPATAAPQLPPATTTAVVAPANPVIEAVRKKLSDKSLVGRDNLADDVAALVAYYGTRTEPQWTKDGAYTDKAKAVIAELRKADDWGLEPADFAVPDLASGAAPDVQGAAEAQFALAALKYARFARGGRLDPVALSNILDMKPPVKDPKIVLTELADASEPDAYLRGLNPKHSGFEKLRQALLKARGPKPEEEKIDPALLVKLPDGKQLKPGAEDDQISLLRQRLKMAAEKSDDERRYDDKLVAAVRAVQDANGIRSNGILNNRTREALNKEGEPKTADPKRNTDRLVANMERWRWLPPDLGAFYVMNNIPEFTSEIWKGDELKLRQKMIVGQPSWPTPVLAASMQFVIFHPDWGMPDGIKVKELLPRLRSASSSGFNFFDQLFGGGSGGAQVLEAYKLQATLNGHPVDPNSINWNSVDIRQYSFTQPPGSDNPLGLVKFRFPNSHDVYMHDTPQRDLFAQTFRALSHGCMRIEEPRRTAEVILGEDKGWSADKVGELYQGGNTITLDKPVPVYLVYFTARVEDDGHLATFADIYGNDDRVMSALRGHPVRYTAPEAIDPSEAADRPTADRTPADRPAADRSTAAPATVGDAGSDDLQDAAPASKKTKKGKQAGKTKREPKTAGDSVQDALSNLF